MAKISPRYIVRLVHIPQERVYALHFELDERTNNPYSPIPNSLRNVIIGYDRKDSEFLISKDPLNTRRGARAIFQFSTTIKYKDVPLLQLRVDPDGEFAAYTYNEFYQECERGGVLENAFLVALMSAYGETGNGRTTSQGLLGYALDALSRQSRILPADELQWASYMLISVR